MINPFLLCLFALFLIKFRTWPVQRPGPNNLILGSDGETLNNSPRLLSIEHSAYPSLGEWGRHQVIWCVLVSGVEHHEQSVEQRLRSGVLSEFCAGILF
jgi:hypothetical protein